MRKVAIYTIALTIFAACGGSVKDCDKGDNDIKGITEEATGDALNAGYVVVSKEMMTLSLYDLDNALICRFDVSIGKHAGNKREVGDMKTPEGEFSIAQIEPAAHWQRDFGDGNGAVSGSYGNWFIRLNTPPHEGIGIHGTHQPESIGTRSTIGCIELRNSDLDSLQSMLREGMRVVITAGNIDLKADGIEPTSEVITTVSEPHRVVVEVADQVAPQEPSSNSESKATTTTTATTTTDGELWHTVIDGDLVGRIAKHYGITMADIRRLNPTLDVDHISIGQRIKIRGEAMETTQPVIAEEHTDQVWHTVVDGDLVGRIAASYGTTSKRIAELNPDINIDKISIGQKIRVK